MADRHELIIKKVFWTCGSSLCRKAHKSKTTAEKCGMRKVADPQTTEDRMINKLWFRRFGKLAHFVVLEKHLIPAGDLAEALGMKKASLYERMRQGNFAFERRRSIEQDDDEPLV